MNQKTIREVIKAGGRIQNHTLIDADNTPHQGARSLIPDRQIKVMTDAGDAVKTVHYDGTRTYRKP